MINKRGIIHQRIVIFIKIFLDLIFAPVLLLVATVARLSPFRIDVGFGPTPIINSPYHKLAMQKYGYRTEFFVDAIWYYTKDYDYAPTLLLHGPLRALIPYWLMIRTLLRYRTLYTYFDGGPLRATAWLYLFEPALLKLSGIKTVIMPFGADVHALNRSPQPYIVHAYCRDYPDHRYLRNKIICKIDLWSTWADHIISGCDWVHYMPYWNTLMISHFAIDTDRVKLSAPKMINDETAPLRLLHAPNHKSLKGTEFILRAVDELQSEGLDINLRILEGVPNDQVLSAIAEADLVLDQLIIGWYAMFAIEAMALETPCMCYLDPELICLYKRAGLLEDDECPLISASPETIKDLLREIHGDRHLLREASAKSRLYVNRHHSIDAIGSVFDKIQKDLG